MPDTIHAIKTPQAPEQDTFVTVADTGWSEETKERMRQAGYDDMDMILAWYS